MHYANLHPLAAVCYLGNIALIWLHKLFGDFLVDVSDIPKEAPDLNTLVEEGSLLDSSGKGSGLLGKDWGHFFCIHPG